MFLCGWDKLSSTKKLLVRRTLYPRTIYPRSRLRGGAGDLE